MHLSPAGRARASRKAQAAGVIALVLLLCGCMPAVPPPSAAPASALAPGAVRIWLYREYEPFDSLARPFVRMNGEVVGISEPGGAFFRDVPPGAYTLTVDTVGHDVNQFVTVAAAAGQTVFVKIESSKLWESDLNYTADTFYTRLVPPEIAQRDLRRARLLGGG
jgi:hypothetical protein